ncbi:hypothetical protein D3C78_1564270 [compost metagenome]
MGVADRQVRERLAGVVDIDVAATCQHQAGGGGLDVIAGRADVALGLQVDAAAQQFAVGIGAQDVAALGVQPQGAGAGVQLVRGQVGHADDRNAVVGFQVIQQHRALGLVEVDAAARGAQFTGRRAQVGARRAHGVVAVGSRCQQGDEVAGDQRRR